MADMQEKAAAVSRRFVLDALAAGHRVGLHFAGTSMRPWLCAGDRILVEPCRARPGPGDVVLYPAGDRLVAHRVVGRRHRQGRARLLVKGDFTSVDPEPLDPARVLGVVVGRRRGSSTLDLRSKRQRFLGRAAALLSPWAIRAGLALPRPARRGLKSALFRAFRVPK